MLASYSKVCLFLFRMSWTKDKLHLISPQSNICMMGHMSCFHCSGLVPAMTTKLMKLKLGMFLLSLTTTCYIAF